MSRLDKFEDILNSYEGREYKGDVAGNEPLSSKQIDEAITQVIRTIKQADLGFVVSSFDDHTKEAVAKAYYTSKAVHQDPDVKKAQVRHFCQRLEEWILKDNERHSDVIYTNATIYTVDLEEQYR